MFGKDGKTQKLEQKVQLLTQQIEKLQRRQEHYLKILRQQMISFLSGLPISPASILQGLPYSEISKEEVPAFIQKTPNLLILDVRTDEGWSQGHIQGAKHVPASQILMRLDELSDKNRPILTICANGNTAVSVAQLLAKEGYLHVYNALGGMAGYPGKLVRPEAKPLNIHEVKGVDRELVSKVMEVLERDVRPGLKRDGGDIQVLSVEDGIVKLKMAGACFGCGAQKRTVEDGIKNHLMRIIPEVKGVEDQTLG
jgi:Fe-S cluster biogenesis protein NfuA/rhodanese-related sulfurtransferase